ncbi:YfbU family protein [Massilia genomosp. 1]|uniref:YfbU family protein n=1 Tax=Massilia genomosp. 1 TaxID=2609280 RepID=A0ABX0MXA5_9BURK|nr:YfbU family protein [Massilia genomosp. 1]NHZ66627.1 hypothetical protein [Massilia genomosp. 1]
MNLSASEKLILTMLCDITEKLGIDENTDGIDPKFIKAALYNDNLWGIKWRYQGFSDGEPNPPKVSDVTNYLDMWSFIEEAHEKLDENGRAELVSSAAPFGNNPQFPGFDGNNECDYSSIASFMVDHLDRFTRFKGRINNSHMPTIDGYDRMYKVFEPIRKTLDMRSLSTSELAAILNARRHPEA